MPHPDEAHDTVSRCISVLWQRSRVTWPLSLLGPLYFTVFIVVADHADYAWPIKRRHKISVSHSYPRFLTHPRALYAFIFVVLINRSSYFNPPSSFFWVCGCVMRFLIAWSVTVFLYGWDALLFDMLKSVPLEIKNGSEMILRNCTLLVFRLTNC